jgi:hypothetical protein
MMRMTPMTPMTIRNQCRRRRTPAASIRALVSLALLSAAGLAARPAAAADVLVRRGSVQPSLPFELEPHLILGAATPPGPGTGTGSGIGVRGSFLLAPSGFLARVDDSVALGIGLDLMRYDGAGGRFGSCVRTTPGPAETTICTEVSTGAASNYAFIPVVMQWNFWLTPAWSVFGEPGLDVFVASGGAGVTPALFVGGRFRVSRDIALTLRLGWPTFTLGGSFFL